MNQKTLERFWRFVSKRQRIYHRRHVLGKPPPWTDDPILQEAHFTNVYRELDPGTIYAKDEIAGRFVNPTRAAFWLLFYRYTGSNRFAFDGIPAKRFDVSRIMARWREIDDPFGHAYLVYPMTNEQTGKDKVELVVGAFEEIFQAWPARWPRIAEADHPEAAYQMIREARKGIGPFTAYQAWVDYSMLGYITWSRDSWVMPGPGALKGASIIWEEGLSVKQTQGAIHWLHDRQEESLDKYNMKWLQEKVDGKREISTKLLYLSDIQNCLCEFSKYWRARETGRITRRYRPAAADRI